MMSKDKSLFDCLNMSTVFFSTSPSQLTPLVKVIYKLGSSILSIVLQFETHAIVLFINGMNHF